MPRIVSTATAVPEHRLDLEQASRVILKYADRLGLRPDLYLRILRNTTIEHRHSVLSEEELHTPLSAKERNDKYVKVCLELAEKVAREAIERAGLTPKDIDSIISVSCTGWMLPSMDGHLINRMGFKSTTRRLPITEMGCAAGAVGLARAREQLKVYPDSKVLLVSVELPSLTFQPDDARMDQIVSTMIFADGAAAVVLSNDESAKGPELLDSRMFTIPGTLDDMGFDLANDGLHIVLTDKVPYLIQDHLAPEVGALLAPHNKTRADVKWCAMHAAGPKVLLLIEKALGMSENDLAASWSVLRDYGNMSSATVLFVLAEAMKQNVAKPGELGIIAAFGPGVTGELVLARW